MRANIDDSRCHNQICDIGIIYRDYSSLEIVKMIVLFCYVPVTGVALAAVVIASVVTVVDAVVPGWMVERMVVEKEWVNVMVRVR